MTHTKKGLGVGSTQNSSLCCECKVGTSLADWQILARGAELCEWTGKDGAACLSPLGETTGSGPWITETSSRNFPFQLSSPQTRKGEAREKARLHASGCFTEILSQALLENVELKHEQKCNIWAFTYNYADTGIYSNSCSD